MGFVLDYGITVRDVDISLHSDETAKPSCRLPWALEGSGFDDCNVLVWTFNFGHFSAVSVADLTTSHTSGADSVAIYKRHKAILDSSQLKIVLLCGPRAEHDILKVERCIRRYTLTLRGFTYKLYIGSDTNRLYLRCPELPLQTWSVDVYHAGRVAEAIKFATIIVGLKHTRPYFLEGSTVLGFILHRARLEKLGFPKLTTETLDSGLRIWLARKGFREESDIQELELVAGSLTQGLLALLQALPRRSPGHSRQGQRHWFKNYHAYDPICPSAKQFCLEQINRLDESLKRRIETLEPSDDHPDKRVRLDQSTALDSGADHEATTHHGVTRTLITSTSGFVALAKDMPTLFEDVVKVATERKNSFLAGLDQQMPSTSLDQLERDMMTSELSILDLGHLAPSMGLDDGLTITIEAKPAAREDQDLDDPDFFQTEHFSPSPQRVKRGPVNKVTDWYKESEKFADKVYTFAIADDHGQERVKRISLCYCFLKIPEDLDAGNGKVYVSIETCGELQRHPKAYAREATDDDIARRLAFKVTGRDSKGNEFEFFPRASGYDAVCRANTLADILLVGTRRETIANRPRRYLFYRRGTAPRGMERFEGGSNT